MNQVNQQRWSLDETGSVGSQIYRILRERIIRGDLQPGARISESEIARECGTSRQPVREAFIKLNDEGLLYVRPQRATLVRKININAVNDVRFVREAIEADIVILLARSRTSDDVTELKKQIKEQRAAAKLSKDRFMALDEIFHRTLALQAGKDHAWRIVESIKGQMDRVRFLSLKHFPTDTLIEQHAQIVKAIAEGNAVAAGRLMRKHLRQIQTSLPRMAEAHPDFFTRDPADNTPD